MLRKFGPDKHLSWFEILNLDRMRGEKISNSRKTILILGTLDTKSEEIKFLRDLIQKEDLDVVIVDNGVLGDPQGIVPDFSNYDTAKAAGTTLEKVRKEPSRGLAIEHMLEGSTVITRKLLDDEKIHGAISLGGAEGGVMAASAMQVLPPGFPKVIVTPLASGVRPFGPFIGIRDILVMHSLIDIAGLNDISKIIFKNAAGAICGMVKNYEPVKLEGDKLIAFTALGTVQKAVNFIFPRLKEAGYEPIIFHANGVGGRVMEDMISRDYFCSVIDLATNELTDNTVGPPAFHDAGPDRLEIAGKKAIPQIIVPGCVDFFAQGAPETIPDKWRDRKKYYHNPKFTLIRPNHEEMEEIAKRFCKKLNSAKGPVRVILPLKGMSIGGLEGGSTYDPEGDRIFFETLKDCLGENIPVTEEDLHVNEEAFADRIFNEFMSMMENL